MTSDTNSVGSYLLSQTRSSKIDDNYLKELNADLELRKQELLEMLKPVDDKNPLLLQKLMLNLEEKQKCLQIMRQIMGKRSENSSVTELIKEAEVMKQNLERKNKMLRNEMEMLWNKTFDTEEINGQIKASQIKSKANLQDEKVPKLSVPPRKTKNNPETLYAKKEKNGFYGKVIELKIEDLKNFQKTKDLKLSLYLQEKFEPKQAFLNLPGSQGLDCSSTMDNITTSGN